MLNKRYDKTYINYRDPTTKAGCVQSSGSLRDVSPLHNICNFFSNFSKSLNFVAPSASANKTSLPRAHKTPTRTAPPFPMFCGSLQTATGAFLVYSKATSLVLSVLPSSTTII